MKNILFVIIFALSLQLHGQMCNDDTHSTNVYDSWFSCQTAANPNPLRGNTHWVMYDLGYVYSIGPTYFWNFNVMGQTDRGMKNILIDYSLDGVNWTQAASYQLPQATGLPTYIGDYGPDLNEIDARYILITATDTWGTSGCAGLSEVRFEIQGVVATEDPTEAVMSLDIYPNPAANFIMLETEYELNEVILLGVTGAELARFPYRERIDVSYLPSGAYMIKGMTAKNEVVVGRFIKQRG